MVRLAVMRRGLLWLALPGLLAGCGPTPAANYGPLVPAHGQITLDGQPLANAVVTFEAEDGQFAYALTDASGRYTLQVDSATNGIPPGRKTVRISTTRKILSLNSTDEGGPESKERGRPKPPPPDRVPEKYNTNSELTVEVTADRSRYDFELLSRPIH
ncbi:MAG: carboxypeptidase-like regulatory domain-containing protein [Planctomycetaceae bacterium]